MADNSNFVLRWEIDNPSAVAATRTADLTVFNEGGFEWVASIRPNTSFSLMDLSLTCCNHRGGDWKFNGLVTLVQIRNPTNHELQKNISLKLNNGNSVHNFGSVLHINHINICNECRINGKVVFEFHINNISSEGGYGVDRTDENIELKPILDLSKFASPKESNNVTLVIGDNKLRVCKDYLAMYSPVFAVMFFGEYD
ncbi:hypothetical protein PENTCL1PPCAC_24378, partial [Pristionchus entomophagus]